MHHAMGCITDGVVAREIRQSCRSVENREGIDPGDVLNKPMLSDSLGFTEHQFADFERDRVANGFVGVEFVRDPAVPQFFQVKCSSPAQWQAYVKHRGARDQNSRNGGGAALTPELLRQAEEMARRTTVDDTQSVQQDGKV
jgi:hypothetical protein